MTAHVEPEALGDPLDGEVAKLLNIIIVHNNLQFRI